MTDQELQQQLSREYAEQDIPICDPDVSKADRDDMVDTVTDYAVEILRWLTKTHCIVKKSEVKAAYAIGKVLQRDANLTANANGEGVIAVLSDLFGTNLFKERNEK